MTDVSVIIAVWNAESTLSKAVDSALAQVGVTLEIILVDDASTDSSLSVARKFAQRSAAVKVVALAENGGPSAARNAALREARGRWAAVLDADDAFLPGRLARLVALGDDCAADVVFDDFLPVDAAGHRTGPSHLAPYALSGPRQWNLEAVLAGCQARPGQPSLGYLKPLLRLAFLRDKDLQYDQALKNSEDLHLILEILAKSGAVWVSPEAGYLYTTAAGSISNRLNPDHARALAGADARFLTRHAPTMSPRAVALMRQRMRRVADLTTAEVALQNLRAGRPGRAIKALFQRPRAVHRLLVQVWSATRSRVF